MGTPVRTSIHGRRIGLTANNELVLGGFPFSFTVTPAAGAANVCNVTIQAVDNEDRPVKAILLCRVWLSDAATGIGLTAVTASGTVVAGAAGTVMVDDVAKKFFIIQTDVNGTFVLSITDTAKTPFRICIQCGDLSSGPGLSNYVGPVALTTANYG